MRQLILLLLILLLSSSPALCYVTEIGIAEVAKIENDRGEFRLLVKLEDIEIPRYARIDFATLVLPRTRTKTIIPIEVRPITRPWSKATVSWYAPWERQGGDFDETCVTKWTIHPGAGGPGHFLDITDLVREQVRGGEAYGFVIKPYDAARVERSSGFPAPVDGSFAGLRDLKVRVLWSEAR